MSSLAGGRADSLPRRVLGPDRRREPGTRIDVPGLAEWTRRLRGQVSVERMAEAAGVSRQHLTRVFHELVGVSPKLYCRLARFHSALGFAAAGERAAWAGVAAALGYADQSHMIAEFREFSSLTPQTGCERASLSPPYRERARSIEASSRRQHRSASLPLEDEITAGAAVEAQLRRRTAASRLPEAQERIPLAERQPVDPLE